MIDARCTHPEAKKTFSIFNFQKLTDKKIEKYRYHLLCDECSGEAYYRRKSSDGKAACFGSRNHTAECNAARPSAQDVKEVKHAVEVNQIISDSNEVQFDFGLSESKPSKPSDKTGSPKVTGSATSGTTKHHTKLAETKRTPVLGMEKALHSLLRGSDLATSDVKIAISEKVSYRAKNLFVNFADAVPLEDSKAFKPKMFWGTISHADKDFDWLNPSCNDAGVLIASLKEELLNTFKIKEHRDLDGAGLILFGNCYWNKEKTRKIIKLIDMKIFISKVDN